MDNSIATARDLIDRNAEMYGDATFLCCAESDTTVSFGELRDACRELSNKLHQAGVSPGASVAFAMNNGPDAATAVLGILYGGYRAVAINLVAGPDIIAYVLGHSETVFIITEPDVLPSIAHALELPAFKVSMRDKPVISLWSDQRLVIQCGDREVSTERIEKDAHYPSISRATDGLLMYTSGTTGQPKGVVLSHGNLLAGGENVRDGHGLTDADRALCVLPLFHINGLCVTLLGPLVSGGSVVMPAKFSTKRFWEWIEHQSCTWFSVVPTQVSYLLRDASGDRRFPNVRFGRSASAPLSPDVHEMFEKRFGIPLIETMGLTETSAQILSNPMPPQKRKLGSPGLPVGVDIRIVDKSMRDVVDGEEGELLIRGDCVMQRYFHNPEATTAAKTVEGWLHTGDLGRADEDGFLFITGRLKELIIKGGENIAPREIDDALYQHPDVVEAAAFACPCDDYGQRVLAAVCIKSGASLAEEELLALCENSVGLFKRPDRIYFMTELPKGPSGKIQRKQLSELHADNILIG